MSEKLKRVVSLGFIVFSILWIIPETSQAETASKRLEALTQEYTEKVMHLDPFLAPLFGIEEGLDKLGDYPSPQYFERWKKLLSSTVKQLTKIQRSELSGQDQINYDLLKTQVEVDLKYFGLPFQYLSFNQMDNRLHSIIDGSNPSLTPFPFDTVSHYKAFSKRISQIPTYIDLQIELLKKGLKLKIVNSCDIAPAVIASYEPALTSDIKMSPFYRPLNHLPADFTQENRAEVTSLFEKAISQAIPAIQKFHRFYKEEYMPFCMNRFGISSLPQGKEMYEVSLKEATHLDISAQRVHELGLAEVARIEKEMIEIKEKMKFKGNLKEFIFAITHDKNNFYKTGKELIEGFQKTKLKVAKVIRNYFSVMPVHDYVIVSTSNPEEAAGSYQVPTEMVPYGRFVTNALNPRSVAKYEAPTLLLHEAVPGHHFQLALQFEMKDRLSEFRRKIYDDNAFEEGWALYSEYLGREMGIYDQPLELFGHLDEEMFRAVRLVVDSGIHAYGWDRKKTIEYITAHVAKDEKTISNEANRYAVLPGQAVGYKVGQIKILELRRLAEAKLGSQFDLKEFHKVVIGNGTISLPVLERLVNEWIASRQNVK